MTYTFIGDSDFIKKELDKIINSFDSSNIVRYNLEEVSINAVVQDLDTVGLFGYKLVIVNNIDVLDDSDLLIKYLDNPSGNTLVLISNKELDKRKKITKVLKEKTKYKEFLNNNIELIVKDNLDDYKISNMSINMLIGYCNSNINRVLNELEKLKMYKYESKEITNSDIEKLVMKSIDSTIFNLIDAINISDRDRIFKIYNELLEEGETDEKIMYTIANHYRLLFQIREKLNDLKDDDIIKEYKMHPYRLTKLKEQMGIISRKKNIEILQKLSEIDIDVKRGKKDIKTAMFLFFEKL